MRFQQTGLLHHDPTRSYAGFTTITPFRHPNCYLVDMAGKTVHQWDLPGALGSKAYLLPGGNLLCSVATDEGAPLKAAKGGRILELDWDGNEVWEHVDHDLAKLGRTPRQVRGKISTDCLKRYRCLARSIIAS